MSQSEYNAHLVWIFVIFPLKIINYNCSGHKFNIFLKYFGSIFKTELSVICSLWNILRKKFHRNNVLNVWTFEIISAQYKRGNSSLYLIFLLICQFIIECTDVDAFIAALDIGLLLCFISFPWLLLFERLLIIHYRLTVSYHYFSFVVNSLNLTFLLLLSVIRKYFCRVSHLFEYQLLEIFKVWPFLFCSLSKGTFDDILV